MSQLEYSELSSSEECIFAAFCTQEIKEGKEKEVQMQVQEGLGKEMAFYFVC